MNSAVRSSVSATSAGQGGSSSNASLADQNSPFPFRADLLSAQDRKDKALLDWFNYISFFSFPINHLFSRYVGGSDDEFCLNLDDFNDLQNPGSARVSEKMK